MQHGGTTPDENGAVQPVPEGYVARAFGDGVSHAVGRHHAG